MIKSIKRSIVAIIIGPLVLAFLWFGGLPLSILCALIGIALILEFATLTDRKLFWWQYALMCLAVVIWHYIIYTGNTHRLEFLLGIFIVLFSSELAHMKNQGTVERVGQMIFLIVMGALLTSTAPLVRAYSPQWAVYTAILVWIVDSAAYWSGSLIGKRKLAEKFSPKKTVEGFICGIVVAVITAFIAKLIYPSFEVLPLWFTAAAASIVGQLGDLFESKIKREFGVKDSSKLMAEHGGIWDRTDSILWVYAVVWIILRLWL